MNNSFGYGTELVRAGHHLLCIDPAKVSQMKKTRSRRETDLGRLRHQLRHSRPLEVVWSTYSQAQAHRYILNRNTKHTVAGENALGQFIPYVSALHATSSAKTPSKYRHAGRQSLLAKHFLKK